VHLVGFYFTNISRYTVLRMSRNVKYSFNIFQHIARSPIHTQYILLTHAVDDLLCIQLQTVESQFLFTLLVFSSDLALYIYVNTL